MPFPLINKCVLVYCEISVEVTQHFSAKCLSLHDVKITCAIKSEKKLQTKNPRLCVWKEAVENTSIFAITVAAAAMWAVRDEGCFSMDPTYPFSPLFPILIMVRLPALPSSAPHSYVFPIPPCTLQWPHRNLHCWPHSLKYSWAKGTGIHSLQGRMVCVSRMANAPSLDLPSLISRNFEELDITRSKWHPSDLVQADQEVQRH